MTGKKASNLVLSIQEDTKHCPPSTTRKAKKTKRAHCGRRENAHTHWVPKCNIRAGTHNHQSKNGCKVAVQLLWSSSYLHGTGRHNSLFMYVDVYMHTNIKACLLFYTSLCSPHNLTSLFLCPPQDFLPFFFSPISSRTSSL